MNRSGNISAKETGEVEIALPVKPNFVEVMFVDGLPDAPPPSACGFTEPDLVVCNIKAVDAQDQPWGSPVLFYAIKIRWQISKPRMIWWQATD